MTTVSFTNTLRGAEALKRAQRRHGRFVNNAMIATLLGDVVSDALEDGRVVSGVGGQHDFVVQAHELDEARGIIVLNSTREGAGGGAASSIRWSYPHTTIPGHLRDIVVTEYGVADLRGKSDRDCIAAMLAVAARFQPELLKAAQRAGKIEAEFRLPEFARRNRPEWLGSALAPLRAQGAFPEYPFGTDLTPVEQRLARALQRLKRWSGKQAEACAAGRTRPARKRRRRGSAGTPRAGGAGHAPGPAVPGARAPRAAGGGGEAGLSRPLSG
ncbi:MAG: acetyl-CoA hydrolase/transferase C-terminal domain-containing protein [Burkholderiales bacterium]